MTEQEALVVMVEAQRDQVKARYEAVTGHSWGCCCPPDPAAKYAACPNVWPHKRADLLKETP